MYAKLIPLSGATIGNLLQELAKICTGNITSAGSLTAFDSANSEIVSTVPTNWTLAYPTAFTANTNTYVLQSQCVATSKYKYARLMVKGTGTNQPFVEPTGGTANVYTLTTAATIYLEMDGATAVDTGTGAVTNATYYHQSNEGHILNTSGFLYVSASARHLLIYSDNATIDTFLVAEYPETAVTTGKNLTPMIAYRGRGGAITVTTTSRETVAAPSYSVAQIPNGYWAANNTSTLQSIDASTSFNTFEFTQTYTGSRLPADRAPLGNTGRQMIARDLVYYDISRSHNFINVSTLTNIRYLPDTASTTTIDGTRYVSANVEYKSFPLITSVLLVPKA
jgi:hypothetical protein